MCRPLVIAFGAAATVLSLSSSAAACPVVPVSIQADARFEPVVAALLRDSATFARQCDRIDGEAVVAVRTLPKNEESCCRARATIRRYDSGAIIAIIELPAFKTDIEYAELLGHEFEHILEQIDGVDLGTHGYRVAGFAEGPGTAYETERARRAGTAVADEIANRR